MKLALQPLVPTCPPFACPDKSSSSLFTSALFSESYELLFPPARQSLGGQALCFDNHLNCPGVYPLWSLCSDLRALCVALFPGSVWSVFSEAYSLFNALGPLFRASVLCFQQLTASFCKIPGVGGIPRFLGEPPRPLRLCVILMLSEFSDIWFRTFPIDRSTSHPADLFRPSTVDCRLPVHNAKIHSNSL